MSTCGEPCDGCPNRAEHHLCDACCHDQVNAIQKENRELHEKLRALLKEARDGYVRHNLDCADVVCDACSFAADIDDALAEPVVGCSRCEETEHAMHLRIRAGYDKTIADSWRAALHREEKDKFEALQELDEVRAEAKALREVLTTAGDRLRACGEQLTEHSYQEMASVLFDLPQATEGES